jgi:hypothetical protein
MIKGELENFTAKINASSRITQQASNAAAEVGHQIYMPKRAIKSQRK